MMRYFIGRYSRSTPGQLRLVRDINSQSGNTFVPLSFDTESDAQIAATGRGSEFFVVSANASIPATGEAVAA